MMESRRLYQESMLDHGKRPRNRGTMTDADLQSEGLNPLCGDRITVYVKLAGGRIDNISFQGSGCLISIASASMMTEAVRGMSSAASSSLVDTVIALPCDSSLPEELKALRGVIDFPMRIRCATLPWRTLKAALNDELGTVTTE